VTDAHVVSLKAVVAAAEMECSVAVASSTAFIQKCLLLHEELAPLEILANDMLTLPPRPDPSERTSKSSSRASSTTSTKSLTPRPSPGRCAAVVI
jgi:hypothetical protein